MSELRRFIPESWFHPEGVFKVVHRIRPLLPDVSGMLFLTLTVNPDGFATPQAAFDAARDRIRRVMHKMRTGVMLAGVRYVIKAPYCVKVEFHKSGWAHFHLVFLTRQFLPNELLSSLWALGFTKVARITNEKFHYLLKYVTKGGGEPPEWVLERGRVRIWQASHGFYVGSLVKPARKPARKHSKARRCIGTIRERLERWKRTAVLCCPTAKWTRRVSLRSCWSELFDELVYPLALAGRYLGAGKFKIDGASELEPWINPQSPMPAVP